MCLTLKKFVFNDALMTKGSKALLEYLLEMLTTMAKGKQLLNLAPAKLYDLVLNSFIKINKALDQFISPQQNQFRCRRCYAKTETALLLKWSILEPSYAIILHIFVEVELYKIGLNSCSLRYTVHRELKINILCIFD